MRAKVQLATPVIDLHNDTIVAHIRHGNVSISRPDKAWDSSYYGVISGPYGPSPMARPPLQIDLPRMRQAGVNVGFFAIDVTQAHNAHAAYALDGLGFMLRDLHQAPEVTIIRTREDLHRSITDDGCGVLLAIEHADVTEGSLNILYALHALGVRALGLTHNRSSRAADGCAEAREGVGLTPFGVRLVREMNHLGMVVDLAHVSPGAFYHALEISTHPVIFSHGNARALCDHPRNLTDDQLRALAQHGGVIGVSYVPMFIDANNPTPERLLDHIDHIAEIAGIECLALGSDFDGGGTLLPDILAVSHLTEGLLARGYKKEDIAKILGKNALRVLDQVLPEHV